MSNEFSIDPINVVIADDHPIFRKGMAATLENISFIKDIAQASDGNEAIKLLGAGNYALVLLDINMEGMDGKTASAIIHKQYPAVKIIAISMIDDLYIIRQMYLNGCHGYLIKNSDETEIVKAIGTVMSGKLFFTPEVLERLPLESEEENRKRLQGKYNLTAAEINLIPLLCSDKSNKELSAELNLSVRTLETHRYNIYRKTGVKNAAALVLFANSNQLLSP